MERFAIADGEPAYEQIGETLHLFGKQVLNAELNSLQMSPQFAARFYLPAVVQHHQQVRWN